MPDTRWNVREARDYYKKKRKEIKLVKWEKPKKVQLMKSNIKIKRYLKLKTLNLF